MAGNKKWLIIPIIIIEMTVAGNLCAQADDRLNGTWVQVEEGIVVELVMANGDFEELYNGVSYRRGTYTANARELTVVSTHIHGGGFNSLFPDFEHAFGLTPKWYSFNEFLITARSALLKLVSEKEANEFVDSVLSCNTTSTYSVDSTTLILTSTVQGRKHILILEKI